MRHQSLILAPLVALAATVTSHAVDLVPFGATWDYMHPTDGIDPAIADIDFDTTWFVPTAFFGLSYNGPAFGAAPAVGGPPVDSGSGAAPFGYGGVTYIDANGGVVTDLTPPAEGSRGTAYFRHDFSTLVPIDFLALEIIADDGAAIYLDGTLLTEINFSGADTWAATSTVGGTENATRLVLGGLGGLAAGTHTLAVSVHQTGVTSSDLGFDMRLSDEGFANLPIGQTDFGGVRDEFLLDGPFNGWINISSNTYLLDNADGGTIRSEAVDVTGQGDLVFTMRFVADEISGTSNFEDTDTFAARLEVDDGLGGITEISLVPAAWDTDGDGDLGGGEFAPDTPLDGDAVFSRILAARVPAGAASVVLVVDGINNSTTEMFTFSDVLLTDVPPSGVTLGTATVGAPAPVTLFVGPGLWTETAAEIFELNDADTEAFMISEPVDVSALAQGFVTLELDASETSVASNFESGDLFTAWVETVDAGGAGVVVPLISGGPDADGDHVLQGTEIAPGAPDDEEVSQQYFFSARLPVGAVSATIVVAGLNNALTETFTVSGIALGEAPPVVGPFSITGVSRGAGTAVTVVWESEAGSVYDLQTSVTMGDGTWTTVDTLTAAGASSSATHDPGAAGASFYRVSRRP